MTWLLARVDALTMERDQLRAQIGKATVQIQELGAQLAQAWEIADAYLTETVKEQRLRDAAELKREEMATQRNKLQAQLAQADETIASHEPLRRVVTEQGERIAALQAQLAQRTAALRMIAEVNEPLPLHMCRGVALRALADLNVKEES